MRMKAKTYGINCLVANYLQLKNLSHMFWFYSHLQKYIIKLKNDN